MGRWDERRVPDTGLEEKLYRQERPAMHTETADWAEQPYIAGSSEEAEPLPQTNPDEEGVTVEPTQEEQPSPDDAGEAPSGETTDPSAA